ncbi:MAG: Sec-independent protein translocase subunit TatB [Propionibacteriales bacterium]|nr:Sec-independent protein translocase subunit TatB [Propionibacteriales bacterium]
MFDIGPAEFMVLALVALFVFGPDKLPDIARQAGRMLKSLRTTVTQAKSQLTDELGPGFNDVDLRDLTPRALVQKHIFDDAADEAPARPGHRPLEKGEDPPYDVDAT